MDEITLEGKVYISSKRAAELTGYAKDYIGQLARSKKITATRVGRAWYVLQADIQQHASGDDVSSRKIEDIQEKEVVDSKSSVTKESSEIPSSLRVESPQGFTRALSTLQHNSPTQNVFKTWGSIQYLKDDRPLFPQNLNRDGFTTNEHKVAVTISKNTNDTKQPDIASVSKVISNDSTKIPRPNVLKNENHSSLSFAQSRLNDIKRKKVKKESFDDPLALTYAFMFFFLVLSMGVFGGFYIPSEWVYVDYTHSLANATESGVTFDFIISYFVEIFDQGVSLIMDFLAIIFSSLGTLFDSGLEFILNLLNLG